MIQKLDEYIDRCYIKTLWFVKYRGNIIYNNRGVRGYKTKGAAKNDIVSSIINMIRINIRCGHFIHLDRCNALAELLNVPKEDIESLYVKHRWNDSITLPYKNLEHYIRENILPELENSKIIEFVKL